MLLPVCVQALETIKWPDKQMHFHNFWSFLNKYYIQKWLQKSCICYVLKVYNWITPTYNVKDYEQIKPLHNHCPWGKNCTFSFVLMNNLHGSNGPWMDLWELRLIFTVPRGSLVSRRYDININVIDKLLLSLQAWTCSAFLPHAE